MVNQITSSHNTLRSGDSTQADRVTKQHPVVAVPKVDEKQQKQQQQQHSNLAGQKQGSLLVQTSLAHRQAAQAQSAQKALQEAGDLLNQLRQMARRSLNAQENKKDQLQQTLHQLKNKLVKLTRESKYEDEPVLHHDLTPRLSEQPQQEGFSMKGLRLNTMRQQDEILRFQFDSGTPGTVQVRINNDENTTEIADKMSQAFAPRNIQVGVDKYGDLSFSVPKEQWPEIKKGVWMSGGGQILPAGNPVKAKLESHDKQAVEPQELEFGKPQSTRKALADIERMMQKIQQALSQMSKVQRQVSQDLERLVTTNTMKSGIVSNDGAIEASWLEAPENVSLQLMDNAVPTLLAQANASRHNVVALLEP
ncbi:hypothetical protein C942_03683 [Photobacterium marinum]|uniref:Flagellin n=1 Tax=Photobacterium marinum TaxID=1056511 RepID=L8JI09_9GAMM|nr:hypothetical protein [Photobacterium marinum]ELR67082.1 hypothetical protein C942_03683 [Photobacterium marinum]